MSEKYSDLYLNEGKNLDGIEHAVVGKALHGDLHSINKHVTAVGQDTILAMPSLNIYGVFDGAGGAYDVGRPDLASQTAALAAEEYFLAQEYSRYSPNPKDIFNREYEIMRGAMKYLRESVEDNAEAGLTTAVMYRIFETGEGATTISYANAGDSALLLYPDPDVEDDFNEVRLIAGDQKSKLYFGSPSNAVGRQPFRLRHLESYGHDQIGFVGFDNSRDRYLLLGSDGVMGDYTNATEMLGYHVDYALEIEPKISAALGMASVAGVVKAVAERRDINLDDFDWEVWDRQIEPLLPEELNTIAPRIGQVASALIQPRIAWEFERQVRPDDKSLVCIKIPAYKA